MEQSFKLKPLPCPVSISASKNQYGKGIEQHTKPVAPYVRIRYFCGLIDRPGGRLLCKLKDLSL